jgi:hypothetical protein
MLIGCGSIFILRRRFPQVRAHTSNSSLQPRAPKTVRAHGPNLNG